METYEYEFQRIKLALERNEQERIAIMAERNALAVRAYADDVLSMRQIAKLIGISHAQVGNIINGAMRAQAFEREAQAFFNRPGPPVEDVEEQMRAYKAAIAAEMAAATSEDTPPQ